MTLSTTYSVESSIYTSYCPDEGLTVHFWFQHTLNSPPKVPQR